MPSFLSKVFGRKKDDKESPRRVADTELLDGKFESVSPSATKFPEVANERQSRHKEKDSPFNVFRSKSRPSSPESRDRRVEVPLLSLNLPGFRDEEASRELGVVFDADPDLQVLSEEAIGRRRLNPLETLILVRACSEAIIARGLETLGIMHPHWYAASPEEQRRLISLFLKSLAPRGSIITLSTTPSAIATAFNSEISSTKSPYDVAAVLRWGLRHLQLEGTSFGKDDNWYKTFFDAERSAGWPPNGYSSTLAPLLPTSHLELLTATLELFSSLAAHAEANGISGSKLSKFFGLWLLAVERVQKDDDWSTFYARWERTGRMLEHLFLSRIRDDATESRMPTRLLELVQRYPYQTDPNADLLARPRFSTIQYDALFVRIETELSATADQPSHHPLRIISEAFKAEASFDAGEHAALWESIRKSGVIIGGSSTPGEHPGEHPEFSHIFADETLRFFSLVPMDMGSSAIGSPSFNLYMRPSHPGSSFLGDKDAATTPAAAGSSPPRHTKAPTSPIPPSDVNSPIGPDWITFSASGFLDDTTERTPLASTLMEKERDMEVTIPRPSSPRLSLFNSRKSSDRPRTPAKSEVPKPSPPLAVLSPVKPASKSTQVSLVQLDEAFVDFWSDALFDPVSSSWPAFIICKLRNVETGVDGKRIEWLVVEQVFKRPPVSLPTSTPEASTSSHASHESPSRARTSSPNSSASDSSFVFGSMFKRFGLLTSPAKKAGSLPQYKEGTKRKGKGREKAVGPIVGEMGEILREEDEDDGKGKGKKGKEREKKDETVRVRVPSPKPKKSVEATRQSVVAAVKKSIDEGGRTNGVVAGSLAAGTAVAAAGAAVAVAAGASEADTAKEPAPVPAPVLAEESTTSGAPVETLASAIPQEVPAPEPVREALLQEETVIGPAAAQNDEAPSTVAPVAEPRVLLVAESVQSEPVSEPQAVQTAVEQAQAAKADVVSVPAVEEAKPAEHVAEPAVVETTKEPEVEVAPAREEAKVPEYKAAPVVEDTEPDVAPDVEETKVLQPQVTPAVEETKVSEPEAASLVEPQVVPAAEEAKVTGNKPAPVVEDAELEVAPAVEETKILQPQGTPVVEAKAPEPEAAYLVEPPVAPATEEAKVTGNEHAPVVEDAELEVAPAVEETKVPQPQGTPFVEEAKVPEPEAASVVEEAKAVETIVEEDKTPEPEIVPAIKEAKVFESETAPVVEEVKTPEDQSAFAIEAVKAPESVVEEAKVPAPVVEEVKASEPVHDVPVAEETKAPEPEVVPVIAETKAFDPEVVPTVDEVKPRELEVTPVAAEIKAPEHEAAPVVEEIRPAAVPPVMEEAKTSDLDDVPTVEEAKVLEHDVAPHLEEGKVHESEILSAVDDTPIVEETKVPEHEVLSAVQEVKTAEADAAPVVKEDEASELKAVPTVEEVKVPEPEIAPVVDETKASTPEVEPEALEVKPAEREIVSTVDQIEVPGPSIEETATELPVVGEGKASVNPEAQGEVAGETTTKDLHDEQREVEPEAVIAAKELVAEPVVKTEAPESEPIVAEESQTSVDKAFQPVTEVLPTEEKTGAIVEKMVEPVGEETNKSVAAEVNEPIVQETAESVAKPVIEGTTELAAEPVVEPVVEEAVQPIPTDAHEIVVPAAEPAVEKTVETAKEPVIEESVPPLVPESHQPIEEPVEPAKQPVIEEPVQPFVSESQQPIVEEPLEPAKQSVVEEPLEPVKQPVVEETARTLVEETHEPVEVAVPVAMVTAEPVIEEISEPALVLDKSVTDDKIAESQKVVANEQVLVEKHVEDAFVKGDSGPPEAIVVKEETSPEVPIAQDVKTSVEEAPSTVSAMEEKSTPIVESVAEPVDPVVVEEEISSVTKESAEVSAVTITNTSDEVKETPVSAAPVPENKVEDVPTPTIEVVPVVEKPGSSASDSEGAPMPVDAVSKEESLLNEPDIVKAKEESSQSAVKTFQEEPVVEEIIASESKPVPPVVESSIGQTPEPVTVPTKGEHAPVVEEPVAAVVESASVVELEKVDAPAVEEAVSEQSAPVAEDVTASAAPVEVTAVQELEAERSTSVKAEPSSAASDNPAAGNIDAVKPENAEEITPIIEEPAPPATRSENPAEPTEQTSAPPQEAVVKPGAEEHIVSVAEPEPKLELHAPVEPVPSTDVAQEEANVHAQTKEVASADEGSTSTTVESQVEAGHETSTLTKETSADVEELTPSAATEPEPEVKTLEAEAGLATANQTMEDSTPIVKEPALSVPAEPTPVAANQPGQPSENIDVEPKEETLVPREEIAPVIKEPAISAAEPETGVVIEVDSSLPIADQKTAESVELLEDTPAPATEHVAAIVEECISSDKAPEPAEAEAVPVDIGHLAKESTDITNAESPASIPIEKEVAPIIDQPQVEANLAPIEVHSMMTENTTEMTPAPVLEAPVIEEPVSSNVVELEPKPEAHHPLASAAADEPVAGIVVVNSTEVSAPTEAAPVVEDPAPSVTAETEPIPVARHELNQEDALTSHPADQTSMPKELIVDNAKEPIAEDPTTSATESRAQTEAPAHTVTEPAPTVEENAAIVDSKELILAPVVEAAPEHAVPKEAPVSSQVDAPATTEGAVQKPVVIESDTSVPAAKEATSVVEERTSVDRELAADGPVNESPAIAVESIAASYPMTANVPAPLADVKPLAVESEPVVETPASVTVKPVLAVIGESKESVPVAEHAPNSEVSDEVHIVKNDTAPVEATIVEEKLAKVEVTPVAQATTESSNSVHETSNTSVSKDDTIVPAENGNCHPAAAKEETTVSAEVPDTSTTASDKD